jgi:hypothetical protein
MPERQAISTAVDMYRSGETPARLWLYEAATLSPLRGGADYRDRFTRKNLSIQR